MTYLMQFFNIKNVSLWTLSSLSKTAMVLNFLNYCTSKLPGIYYKLDSTQLNEMFNYFLSHHELHLFIMSKVTYYLYNYKRQAGVWTAVFGQG